MRICVACSAGGHMTEMLQLTGSFKDRDHFFVTADRMDTANLAKGEKVLFVTDPGRNPLKLAVNVLQTLAIILREKPDVILSTGAGIAIPACYIGKLLGKKVIFIESVCRTGTPSLSGRAAYPVSDKFLVQWKGMLSKYGRKAEYWGSVI